MFSQFLVFIIALTNLVECFSSSKVCGIKLKNRIVGGQDASDNEWPWMVSVQYNYKHICGATLIDNQWAVTAAHCFNFKSPSAYKLIIGGHNITNNGLGTNAIRRSVTQIVKHEQFTDSQDFDIALLKFDNPISFNMNVTPACLAEYDDNFENQYCYFAGWGLTFSNGIAQNTLRYIKLNVLNQTDCSKYVYESLEQKYCTGDMNSGRDTCQGDSGGGMMCQKSDFKWYLAGVVSYGIESCGNIGISARLDYFREWINKKIEKLI